MKSRISKIKSPSQNGSVLAGTIILTAIIGGVLAAYLSYLQQQNYLVHRSIAWNSTVPIAEAGIEEALAQLNENGAVFANNGFEVVQGAYIVKTRALETGSYVVGFSMETNPVIVAQGTMPGPLGKGTVTRTLKVRTKRLPMFSAALVLEREMDINGRQIEIDSFDSSLPTYNTGGQYDPLKRRDKATVATNSGVKDSVKTGGARIFGKVMTGAGGTVQSGNISVIGDFAWHSAHPTGGVDPAAISDDFNFELGTVSAPFVSGFPPQQNVTTNGVTYDYLLGDGDYKIASPLVLKGKILVTGKARVYIAPDSAISLSGTDSIQIISGASLEIYCAAATASLGGQGVLNTGLAKNLTYFGLPSNTKLAVGGNANFTGAIYAPQTAVTLGGGGSTVKDFCGAMVAKSVVFNGTYNFHFDEDLARHRYRNFVATSWEEIGSDWDEILSQNLALSAAE